MKKTGMAKSDAKKLMGKMTAPGGGGFGQGEAPVVDRRQQRKREQALGLMPFAVKLDKDLVQKVRELAAQRNMEINDLVAELLGKALETDPQTGS